MIFRVLALVIAVAGFYEWEWVNGGQMPNNFDMDDLAADEVRGIPEPCVTRNVVWTVEGMDYRHVIWLQ